MWTATPSVPPDQISEVDFLIDGRPLWVEHSAPYDYGNDGNFLVTSFLSAGSHTFTAVLAVLPPIVVAFTMLHAVPQ